MKTPTLILASVSPRRAELLRQIRGNFEIVPSEAVEIPAGNLSAGELAQINAYRKARAVSKKFPDAIVLGADTLVSVGRKIFGKPRTAEEARGMLVFLQGQTHQVSTGVCLIYLRGHRQKIFCEQTDVQFHALTLPQIRRYQEKVNPMDKAGGYAIQEHAADLVESVSGSFSNVVGLPLERLRLELDSFVAGSDVVPSAAGFRPPPVASQPDAARPGL